MSRRTIQMTDTLYDYLHGVAVRDLDILKRLREETQQLPQGGMQISPEQGQLMAFLVKLIGAKRTLEVGTFTGYSSLCVAMALPEDGRLVACDISDEWTKVARRYWAEAGVASKIDLRLAPGADSLAAMIEAGETESFDFAFIDADKSKYDTYYELSLQLLRPGGMMALDNMLRGGAVADPTRQDEDTSAIRALNEKIHADARVDMCLVPIGDGLTLVRKR